MVSEPLEITEIPGEYLLLTADTGNDKEFLCDAHASSQLNLYCRNCQKGIKLVGRTNQMHLTLLVLEILQWCMIRRLVSFVNPVVL